MKQSEQINRIYSHLPPMARQEALHFLLFLQQQYDDSAPLKKPAETADTCVSIRKNPAFGMWHDLEGNSREFLNQIRLKQWS